MLLLSAVLLPALPSRSAEPAQGTPVVKTITLAHVPVQALMQPERHQRLRCDLVKLWPDNAVTMLADTQRNALIVQAGNAAMMAQVEECIRLLDQQIPRVSIAWQMVEMPEADARRFASSWTAESDVPMQYYPKALPKAKFDPANLPPNPPYISPTYSTGTAISFEVNTALVLQELLQAKTARAINSGTVILTDGDQYAPAQFAMDKPSLRFTSAWIHGKESVELQAELLAHSPYGAAHSFQRYNGIAKYDTVNLVGSCLSNNSTENEKRRILVFATPTLIAPEAPAEEPAGDRLTVLALKYLNADAVSQELAAGTGITQIIPLEGVHAIIVRSQDAEALAGFREIVASRDIQPQPATFEATLVKVSPEDAEKLFTGDLQTALIQAIANKRAKRVVAAGFGFRGGDAGSLGWPDDVLSISYDNVSVHADNSVTWHGTFTSSFAAGSTLEAMITLKDWKTVLVGGWSVKEKDPATGAESPQRYLLFLSPTAMPYDLPRIF